MIISVKCYAGFATGDMVDKHINLEVPDNFNQLDTDERRIILDKEFNSWASANIISEYFWGEI